MSIDRRLERQKVTEQLPSARRRRKLPGRSSPIKIPRRRAEASSEIVLDVKAAQNPPCFRYVRIRNRLSSVALAVACDQSGLDLASRIAVGQGPDAGLNRHRIGVPARFQETHNGVRDASHAVKPITVAWHRSAGIYTGRVNSQLLLGTWTQSERVFVGRHHVLVMPARNKVRARLDYYPHGLADQILDLGVNPCDRLPGCPRMYESPLLEQEQVILLAVLNIRRSRGQILDPPLQAPSLPTP
jgi:hypothetical protein